MRPVLACMGLAPGGLAGRSARLGWQTGAAHGLRDGRLAQDSRNFCQSVDIFLRSHYKTPQLQQCVAVFLQNHTGSKKGWEPGRERWSLPFFCSFANADDQPIPARFPCGGGAPLPNFEGDAQNAIDQLGVRAVAAPLDCGFGGHVRPAYSEWGGLFPAEEAPPLTLFCRSLNCAAWFWGWAPRRFFVAVPRSRL